MNNEIKGIVRIASKDLDGHKPIPKAILAIKGISVNLANAIAEVASEKLGVDKYTKVGQLSDDQAQTLEKIILNPVEFGVPEWMVNRRKDYTTGKDVHLTESDLDFTKRQDIEREKKIKSYRGIRHIRGLPVRGQRTRSTFRHGPSLGVKRKKKPGKK